MKVLPRQDLISVKQKEEEREVLRGAKIAKEVDRLRELRVVEEENLKKFRETALREVQEDINRKAQEKDALDSRINERKKELEKLFEPLDLQFARFVRETRQGFEVQNQELSTEEQRLASIAEKQEKRDQKLTEQSHVLKQQRIEITKLNVSARNADEKAQQSLRKAHQDAQNIISEAEIKMIEARDFEKVVQRKAQGMKNREDALKEKEKHLDERELRLELKELQLYSPIQPINYGKPIKVNEL